MNCFAHAYPFLDADPYFLAGTAIPDWLSLIDRRVRARSRSCEPFCEDSDSVTRNVACGIVQHHKDDDWFHNNETFLRLNHEFAIQIRDLLGADAGFRPHLAGHIVIEMLLDGWLAEKDLKILDEYYRKIDSVDPDQVEQRINQFATRPTRLIAEFIPRFVREGYLYDYLTDDGVIYRLNRVLIRVRLEPLPNSILQWLPEARREVENNAKTLLPFN